MRTFNIANDIIPLGEFKTGLSKWIKNIQKSEHPLVITQNGKPAGVLLSPIEYDSLVYRSRLSDSVSRGLCDAENGAVLSTQEMRSRLNC